MTKTAFFGADPAQLIRVYGKGRQDGIREFSDCYAQIITPENFMEHKNRIDGIEAVFSTWGMWPLTPEQLNALPRLKIVFYAAGSAKNFAAVLFEKNIRVISAWGANAIPVAEFTAAQIILGMKNYFENSRNYTSPDQRRGFEAPGNFGETVVLLGAGMIGRKVIELLSPFTLDLAVWDPFLSDDQSRELGVRKIKSLADAFKQGFVVSNHLANVPETTGVINGECFSVMREHAVFINTGRGATVRESEMIDVFRKRPDLTALLDVTFPEPPLTESPLYHLKNIHLSGHIAGSLGDEVVRMADFMIDEFKRWERGDALFYEVTREMLATLA